jgi:hypothetical protein
MCVVCSRALGSYSSNTHRVHTYKSRTYIHAYIHTYIRICATQPLIAFQKNHVHTCKPRTYIRTYVHKYKPRTYTQITNIHTYIHTYLHTYVRTCATQLLAALQTNHVHTYVYTYIHTYIRTCATLSLIALHTNRVNTCKPRTYIHTYIHTCATQSLIALQTNHFSNQLVHVSSSRYIIAVSRQNIPRKCTQYLAVHGLPAIFVPTSRAMYGLPRDVLFAYVCV